MRPGMRASCHLSCCFGGEPTPLTEALLLHDEPVRLARPVVRFVDDGQRDLEAPLLAIGVGKGERGAETPAPCLLVMVAVVDRDAGDPTRLRDGPGDLRRLAGARRL